MSGAMARAIMALVSCCLDESRQGWGAAMRAELAAAQEDGRAVRFALGCLAAAWREMLTRAEGRFVLTSYALVLGLLIPMAALQIGCALFGFPYLYPGQHGLSGALLEGRAHEPLLRSIYQAAIPALAVLQLLIGFGHLRIAWVMLERDWNGVMRVASLTLAAAVTLLLFMSVLFLNGAQALLQGSVLAVELATIAMVARRQAQLFGGTATAHG